MKQNSIWLFLLVAANSLAATDYLQTDVSSQDRDVRKSDTTQGYLGGMSNQLNDDIGNVPGNRYNGTAYFDYHKRPTSTNLGDKRLTAASMLNDQGLLMYSLQEAYLNYEVFTKDTIKVGRQILNWSPVDANWGFGKLNNRRNFDYFEPGQEGLVGVQYVARFNSGMRLGVFASGLYIPELNPGLSVDDKNKTITSKHAWSKAPEKETEIVPGITAPIQYNVDVPSISEVVFRYSAGVNLGYEKDHITVDNFFMRKPENQLSAKAKVNVNTIEQVVKADITPQFYYHDLYGSTVRYRNRDLQVYLSAIAIRPNFYPDGDARVTEFTEIPTEKRREDYAGGGISRSNDLQTYGFNYVARLSPFDRKTDKLAEDPRWNQAVNVFLSRNFGRYYTLMGDVKYDMLTTDRMVMIKAIYNASRLLQLNAGVNMIGTPTDGKSFWSPYTNNDSVYGGLRLIF